MVCVEFGWFNVPRGTFHTLTSDWFMSVVSIKHPAPRPFWLSCKAVLRVRAQQKIWFLRFVDDQKPEDVDWNFVLKAMKEIFPRGSVVL